MSWPHQQLIATGIPDHGRQDGRTALDKISTRIGYGAVLSERGYRVGLAGNGREALDYLRDYPAIDLIILDMLTPVMDGWQFLKHRAAQWPSVPVLIATAISVASKEWAASLGAADIMCKPIDGDVLLEHVEKCLGSQ